MLLGGIEKYLPNTFEAAELYFLMGECYMEQVFLIEVCILTLTWLKIKIRTFQELHGRPINPLPIFTNNYDHQQPEVVRSG